MEGTDGIVGRVVGLLAAIAALGGYVLLLGGIVFWLRLEEAGLPSEPAVAGVPRNELFAVGMQVVGFWILLLVVGLAAAVTAAAAPSGFAQSLGPPLVAGLLGLLGVRAALAIDRWWAYAVLGLIILVPIVVALREWVWDDVLGFW